MDIYNYGFVSITGNRGVTNGILVENCHVSDSQGGSGLFIYYENTISTSITVKNSIFERLVCYGGCGFYFDSINGTASIQNCTFQHLFAVSAGGDGISMQNLKDILISDSIFNNCSSNSSPGAAVILAVSSEIDMVTVIR